MSEKGNSYYRNVGRWASYTLRVLSGGLTLFFVASLAWADTIFDRSTGKTVSLVENCLIGRIDDIAISYYKLDPTNRIVVQKHLYVEDKDLTFQITGREEILQLLREWSAGSIRALLASKDGHQVTALAVSLYTQAPAGTNWVILGTQAWLYHKYVRVQTAKGERRVDFEEAETLQFGGAVVTAKLRNGTEVSGRLLDEEYEGQPLKLHFWGIDVAQFAGPSLDKILEFRPSDRGKDRFFIPPLWYLMPLDDTQSVRFLPESEVKLR